MVGARLQGHAARRSARPLAVQAGARLLEQAYLTYLWEFIE